MILVLTYINLSYLILSYLILSYLILSYLILSYLILSYLILPDTGWQVGQVEEGVHRARRPVQQVRQEVRPKH
jgi:hypothetical protein